MRIQVMRILMSMLRVPVRKQLDPARSVPDAVAVLIDAAQVSMQLHLWAPVFSLHPVLLLLLLESAQVKG